MSVETYFDTRLHNGSLPAVEAERRDIQSEWSITPLPGVGFNATGILNLDGSMLVVSRMREIGQTPQNGEPDYTMLLAQRVHIGNQGEVSIANFAEYWHPRKAVIDPYSQLIVNREDLRLAQTANGAIGGFTEVVQNQNEESNFLESDQFSPYPAVMIFSQDNFLTPRIESWRNLGKGKNLTPFEVNDEPTFLFRPESTFYDRKLQIVQASKNLKTAEVVGDFEIPQTSWGERYGTTAGFFKDPVNENSGLLLIHGIHYTQRMGSTESIANYSIGAVRLLKGVMGWEVNGITPKPLITPDDLRDFGGEDVPGKKVVYSCGAWEKDGSIAMLVNKGDSVSIHMQRSRDEIEDKISEIPTQHIPLAA